MKWSGLLALAVATAVVASGCVNHIADYEPKRRQYRSPVDFKKLGGPSEKGSLFHPGYPGEHFFADQRAMRLGDIVTVRVKEEANAKRNASTETARNGSTGLSIPRLFGLMSDLKNQLGSEFSDGNLLQAAMETDFAGSGKTTRSEHLEATVPAIVREVLPNGNLFIEGHRVILVNNEEHHFYLSGVIRPVDIDGENSVQSTLMADAEIEFTGRGVISEKQSPGWLTRALDYAAPL